VLPIFEYIRDTWATLTRDHRHLALAAADPKFHPDAEGRWPVYVSPHEPMQRVEEELRRAMHADFGKIELRVLPADPSQIRDPGLLYLPKPYVVPGGRFNEMYGWDSFFIELGLLRDGQISLAQDMVDNFLYEVREYGKILNANRTYYLTRSQPPFLTEMILTVYRRTHDRNWLAETFPIIEQYYRYWNTEPHLTPATGLSRYYDLGQGPAAEAVSSEADRRGRTDYDLIRAWYRTHAVADYDAGLYCDREHDRLTELFYKGDRSMRESGFDPSNRFGPFSVDIIHYNPVCLNSLLHLMETESAEIADILGHHSDAAEWRERAKERAARMNRLMWDTEQGIYYDYDFVQHRIRRYPFLTTFYPLWAGIANREQAAQVVHNLPLFERSGGLQTGTRHTGDQWDAPFGWAPLQWIAVQGLRRYGYNREADRISMRFLTMVLGEYQRYGTIDEKYDVRNARAELGHELSSGYHGNEAGFGWTNAVFTLLFDELPATSRRDMTHAAAGPRSRHTGTR
jgi:alpha,alpha-trehalase